MSSAARPLIVPTAHPQLEEALRLKLERRVATAGGLGELVPLALRLGLIQGTLRPRLRQPQLLLFAGDHGLAVDLNPPQHHSTAAQIEDLLACRVPLPVFAHQQGMTLDIVDCGLASAMPARPGMLLRKIAHGTRNGRVTAAMTLDQVNAALRAGMEIAKALPGNVLGCAGLGVGSGASAALVISRITGLPLRELVRSGARMDEDELNHVLTVLHSAHSRHPGSEDPVQALASFGGFEMAVMVGAMLVAASKRHLLLIDGMTACAALMLASRIATPVTDYCVFCRSQTHHGLDRALGLFQASALLELGLDTTDGTGACLSWPLVHSAAALLTELSEEDVSQPAGMDAPVVQSLYDPSSPTIPGLP